MMNTITKAVRLHGKNDVRLDEFELPAMQEDEILAKVVSDSLCTSSYKACVLGSDHKRVPSNIATNPIILGHEFCGEIVKVGSKWSSEFHFGEKFTVQPALYYKGSLDGPGYSYEFIGGDATYIIIPNIVMEQGCLLKFTGDAFFQGSLSEPLSCVIGACRASYHTSRGSYVYDMGIKERGTLAILAGTGPMGLAALDYCIHGPRRPSRIVVSSRNREKIERAMQIYTITEAREQGVELLYVHSAENHLGQLLKICPDGFDDVLVMAPSVDLLETADSVLGKDGCLNFFAGPIEPDFSVNVNFYNVHYNSTHIVGTSGGSTDDMKEALTLMEKGMIHPAAMVTHVGGLNSAAETTLALPKLPGSKKLIYTHKNLPLTALEDFAKLGKSSRFFAELADITESNNGMWSIEAEKYLLAHAEEI